MTKMTRTATRFLGVLCCSWMVANGAFAGGASTQPDGAALDPASADALQKTLQDLQTGSDRDAIANKDPQAQAVNAQVQALAGNSANMDAIYGLSADVFEKIVKDTGGDVNKLQEIMNQAKMNPKAFYEKYFTAQEKAKLHELSGKISNSPTNASSPSTTTQPASVPR
jgi:hypothetical protein